MNNQELKHLLPDYLSGRLNPPLRQLIEERLAQSEELRRARDAAQLYTDALAAMEPVEAPDDFLERVHERIDGNQGVFDRLFRPFHAKLPIELAGIAVTVMLVIFMYNPFSGRVPPQIADRTLREYPMPAVPADTAVSHNAPAVKPVFEATCEEKSARARPAEERRAAKGGGAPVKKAAKKRDTALMDKKMKTVRRMEKREVLGKTLAARSASVPEPVQQALAPVSRKPKPAASTPPRLPEPEPSASSPQAAPRLQESTDAAPASAVMGYAAAEKEVFAEEDRAPVKMRQSVKRRMHRKKSAAVPAAAMNENSDEQADTLTLSELARKYDGDLDSVLENSAFRLIVRVSLPESRKNTFEKEFGTLFDNAVIAVSDTDPERHTVTLTVTIRR